jgi:hypothetical protein
MKLKELFSKTPTQVASSESAQVNNGSSASAKLDLDALDDCVGGRAETEGVGCYLNSTKPRLH